MVFIDIDRALIKNRGSRKLHKDNLARFSRPFQFSLSDNRSKGINCGLKGQGRCKKARQHNNLGKGLQLMPGNSNPR